MAHFAADDRGFTLDGKPFRVLGGAIHYFRVPPAYSEDRLRRLKACGLNTVETYVAWNFHEPSPGTFRFEGGADIAAYLETAARVGLKAIVRPGPYICSEWDLGGLPSWLLRDPGMRLRCLHQPYTNAVDRFFDRLLRELVPLQCTRGGPVLAMQVENEYGSYGNDRQYLTHIAEGLKRRGVGQRRQPGAALEQRSAAIPLRSRAVSQEGEERACGPRASGVRAGSGRAAGHGGPGLTRG